MENKTNMHKIKILTIGFYKAPNININNTDIPYSQEVKLLGLTIKRNNFFVKQVENNVNKAKAELKKIKRFRNLNKKLKVRLYKSLVLPILTYPVVSLNICSRTQIQKLQVVQNHAIRWISNEYWPNICPLNTRHQELKIEYIEDRIKRLAEGVWNKVEEENDTFHIQNKNIIMQLPHTWFPSSYLQTFE